MIKSEHKEIRFDKKLITSVDPAMIGENYQSLKNLRYTPTHVKGVAGMTKINSTALSTYLKVRASYQFNKDQPSEKHLLVHAYNAGLTASCVLQHTGSVPATGSFDGTALWTDSTGSGEGRFSKASNGYVGYANGIDTCLWGGDESPVGGFYNLDPDGSFNYDYTDQVRNTLNTDDQVATVAVCTGGNPYSVLLLHLENNTTDSSTSAHTVTNTNVTFNPTYKVFGSYGTYFDGSAYLSTADHADFNFSGGAFCFDAWVRCSSLSSNRPLYYQKTDVSKISFTTGTVEITAGSTINGQTSSATGIVDYVDVTSGTWGGGTAAGDIYMHSITGTWQNAENIRVSTTVHAVSSSTVSDAGDNYVKIYVDTNGAVKFIIHECYGTGSDVVSVTTPNGMITAGATLYHVEVSENESNFYIFINGIKKAQATDSSRMANYTSDIYIGYDGSAYLVGSLDEVRVSSICRHTANFTPPVVAYGTSTSVCYFNLLSTQPIDGFKLYTGTANTQTSDMAVYYWNGTALVSVSNLTDGTAVDGISLAQTGAVSFDSTADLARVKEYQNNVLYLYTVYISATDTTTTIYHVTVSSPFQQIKDIWDGVDREAFSFLKYDGTKYTDYTTQVAKNDYYPSDTSTYAELDSLTTSGYCVAGFKKRMLGVRFSLTPSSVNTTASTAVSVYYWNGATWALATLANDGTSADGISLAQSGTITWNPPENEVEFKTQINKNVLLYYYKFSFSQSLSSDVQVEYIAGIPAQETIRGYKFPVFAQGRLMLCSNSDENKNVVLVSAKNSPNVYNGEDSAELYIGDDTELTAGVELFSQFGSSLFNLTIFFKNNEMWALSGNAPDTWELYRISEVVGCPAHKTLTFVNLPTENAAPGGNRNLAIWQGSDGIYMSDGRAPVPVHFDIENYFDKNKPECIPASMIGQSVGFYDPTNYEYHWLFASGATATTLNKELVLNIRLMKWFEIDRGTGYYLQHGMNVRDSYGNAYTYGFLDTGYMEHLEYGTTFDGGSIIHELWTGEIAPYEGSVWYETQLRTVNLIMAAKTVTANSVSVTHYGDSSTTANTGTPFYLSPASSGKRLAFTSKRRVEGLFVFHSLKFNMTTYNETVGFEPMFLVMEYQVRSQDK